MFSFPSISASQVTGQDYFNLSYSASEQHNYDSAMYFISKAIALDTTMSKDSEIVMEIMPMVAK